MPSQCRVWIVNHYADAPDRPKGTRHYDLARQLVASGKAVTIFAAGLSHVTGREERLARGQLYRTASYQGVQFVWVRTFPYRGNNWRRQVNMLTFLAAFLVVQTRFPAPDVVIGSTVHPFAALGGWIAARLRHAHFLFEIRDLWPQTLVDLGALREGSAGERLLRGIEAFLVRRASVVIALLPGLRAYLLERGLPVDHVVYLPNGVDLAVFDAERFGALQTAGQHRAAISTIESMRADGRFVFGYVGSLGRVNAVSVLVRAATIAEARAPGRIALVCVGDGPERPSLERLADGSAAVALAPAVPKQIVPTILRSLDATVVHATATPVYRYGISFNKLFEYMAAARPVVFACVSAYDPVAATEAGVVVRPDDADALAGAFLQLADTPVEELARMGAAGRAYVEREHNVVGTGKILAALIDRLVARSSEVARSLESGSPDTDARTIRDRAEAARPGGGAARRPAADRE